MIKLGEVNKENGLYEYAVITDPNSVSLYVLARDVGRFKHLYEDEVIEFCNKAGFSSYYNQPIDCPQPPVCKYYDGMGL